MPCFSTVSTNYCTRFILFCYFDERRKDIFMPRESVPMTAGFMKQPWKNFGKVTNQGVEVSLNVNKQFGKDLFVSLMGTFTYAHNEITEKDEPSAVVGTNRAETGHPVGQLTGSTPKFILLTISHVKSCTANSPSAIPVKP